MSTPFRTSPSLALICFVVAAAAWPAAAESTVARLTIVRGNVLVARQSSMASVDAGKRLAAGSRVLTTATASAVVEFDDGCRVEVGPSQRFVVAREGACPPPARALVANREGGAAP
jgi:hypothetical protein